MDEQDPPMLPGSRTYCVKVELFKKGAEALREAIVCTRGSSQQHEYDEESALEHLRQFW